LHLDDEERSDDDDNNINFGDDTGNEEYDTPDSAKDGTEDDEDSNAESGDESAGIGGSDMEEEEDEEEDEVVLNENILRNFRQYTEKASANYAQLDPDVVAGVKLLGLFANKRVPKGLYEQVVKWHMEHLNAKTMTTRQKLLQKLEARYHMALCKPLEQSLVLPYSGSRIKLCCHDFKAQLQALLSDPRIRDDNYLFYNKDPFAPPPEEWTHIGDINTGRCYRETYKQLITDPGRQVLLPIIFYMDGAVTGQFDNLPIEILKFTLGIFNDETRNKAYVWKNLGYVRNFKKSTTRAEDIIAETDHLDAEYYVKSSEFEDKSVVLASVTDDSHQGKEKPKAKQKEKQPNQNIPGISRNGRRNLAEDAEDPDAEVEIIPACNAQDLHAMLDVFLETYKALEDEGGIHWDLHYDGQVRKVHFIPFIMFVKGDTQEHDKHCGKYLSRTKKVKNLCRYCCVPNEKTDEAYTKFVPKTQEMIQKLVDKGDEAKLQGISQQNLDNCWYKFRFGLHNKQGIHGACPVEIIHWFQLGKFKYGRTVLFDQMGKDSELSKEFDALATLVGMTLHRQSDRSLPRVVFAKGIKAGKMQAGQMDGVILILVATLCTTKGREMLLKEKRLRKRFGTVELIGDWIMLLETFLQWKSWLKLPELRVFDVKRFKTKVREIMEMEKRIGPRLTGMKNRTFNFHAGLHVGDDILNFGVPRVVNTESNESHHKESKTAALQTQRIPETFDKACADNIHYMDVVQLAVYEDVTGRTRWDYFQTDEEIFEPEQEIRGNDTAEDDGLDEDSLGSADEEIITEELECWFDFWIKPQIDGKDVYTYKVRRGKYDHNSKFDSQLVKFLGKILQKVKAELPILSIFTCYKRNGQIFRGHPNYRLKPWHDWVNIDWGNGWGIQPGHIWCFLDLRELTREYHVGDVTAGPDLYAVVESTFTADLPDDIAHIDDYSSIFEHYTKYVGDEPCEDGTVRRQFYLAPVDSFHSPCILIPDIGNSNPAAYLKMKPTTEWADQFVEWLGEPHSREFTEES